MQFFIIFFANAFMTTQIRSANSFLWSCAKASEVKKCDVSKCVREQQKIRKNCVLLRGKIIRLTSISKSIRQTVNDSIFRYIRRICSSHPLVCVTIASQICSFPTSFTVRAILRTFLLFMIHGVR